MVISMASKSKSNKLNWHPNCYDCKHLEVTTLSKTLIQKIFNLKPKTYVYCHKPPIYCGPEGVVLCKWFKKKK